MLPKRLRISQLSTDTLKILKGKTGLTPNIVCRMALVLSLEAGASGGTSKVDQSGSEFNAPTLFGEFGTLFEALITQVHGALDTKEMADVIASHIEDGLGSLRKSGSLLELIEYCGFASKGAMPA
jgi:DNA sulfur modification protein DndE